MTIPAGVELARPVAPSTFGGRMELFHVATLKQDFNADPERVYRVLKGVAEGHGGEFEWAEVVARSEDRLLCDFWTEIRLPRGRRLRFRTRESVALDPPSKLHYRHRSGPSRGVAETISIERHAAGSRLTYRAVYPSRWRWWGRIFVLFAKPVAHLFMHIHFRELRRAAEQIR